MLKSRCCVSAGDGADIERRIMKAVSRVREAIGDNEGALLALLDLVIFAGLACSYAAERRVKSNMEEVYRIKRLMETSPGRFENKRGADELEAAVEKIMVEKRMADPPDKPTHGRAYAERVLDALPKGAYTRKGDNGNRVATRPSRDTVRRKVADILDRWEREAREQDAVHIAW